jgi:uncharacterized protein YukE
MSNEIMNVHCDLGQPCGSDADIFEVADWGGELVREQLAKIADLEAEVAKYHEALADCAETLRYNLVMFSRKDEPMMLKSYNNAMKALGKEDV